MMLNKEEVEHELEWIIKLLKEHVDYGFDSDYLRRIPWDIGYRAAVLKILNDKKYKKW